MQEVVLAPSRGREKEYNEDNVRRWWVVTKREEEEEDRAALYPTLVLNAVVCVNHEKEDNGKLLYPKADVAVCCESVDKCERSVTDPCSRSKQSVGSNLAEQGVA